MNPTTINWADNQIATNPTAHFQEEIYMNVIYEWGMVFVGSAYRLDRIYIAAHPELHDMG